MLEKDLNDTQKKALNTFREALRAEVQTWSDLYNFMHRRADIARRHPDEQTMMNALYSHRAFVMALQDLPDEGDAQVIVDRMAFIMVHDQERLGAKLMLLGDNPNINVIVIDKEALAEIQKMQGQEPPEPEVPAADPKKMFH